MTIFLSLISEKGVFEVVRHPLNFVWNFRIETFQWSEVDVGRIANTQNTGFNLQVAIGVDKISIYADIAPRVVVWRILVFL